jgi:hypothetical protein
MAEIKNVTLQIEDGSSSSKKKAVVGFNLLFSSDEAGKTFSYGIKLRSEDKPGDEEGTANNGALLYTFTFGIVAGITYKNVTALAGTHPYTETREVSIQKLNEDPLHDTSPNNPPIFTLHPDEIYAVVNLVADEERSPTVNKTY